MTTSFITAEQFTQLLASGVIDFTSHGPLEVLGNVHIRGTCLEEVNLGSLIFKGGVSCSGDFRRLNCGQAVFEKQFRCEEAVFWNAFVCGKATFRDTFYIDACKFWSGFYCSEATFNGKFVIQDGWFNNIGMQSFNCGNATFNGDFDCGWGEFAAAFSCRRATFNGDFDCNVAKFTVFFCSFAKFNKNFKHERARFTLALVPHNPASY